MQFIGSLAPKERRLPVPVRVSTFIAHNYLVDPKTYMFLSWIAPQDFKNLIRSCTQTIAAESFLVSLRIADTAHDQAKLLDAERKAIFSASRSRDAWPWKSLLTCAIDGAGMFPSLKSFCEGVAQPLWASTLAIPKIASEYFVYNDPVEVLLSFWSILQTQCVVVPQSLSLAERYELWNDIFDIVIALCIVQACMVLGDHAGGKICNSKSSDAGVDESLSASMATAASVKTKGGENVVFPHESLGSHESLELFYQQILIACGVGADNCQRKNKQLQPEHLETIAKELESYIGHVRRQLLLIHSVLLFSTISSFDSSDNASAKEDLRPTPLAVLFSSHADDVSTRFQLAYRRVLKSLFEEVKNARVSQSEIPPGSLLELIRGWLPCKNIRPARCSLLSRVPRPMVALPTQLNTYFQRVSVFTWKLMIFLWLLFADTSIPISFVGGVDSRAFLFRWLRRRVIHAAVIRANRLCVFYVGRYCLCTTLVAGFDALFANTLYHPRATQIR